MKPWIARATAGVALTLAVAACTGVIEEPSGHLSPSGVPNGVGSSNGAGSANGSGSLSGGGSTAATDPNAAGTMPLRRLTNREYNNTVHDLFGDTTQPADAFPLDDTTTL